MDASGSFLSCCSCICPEVSVRSLSRCPQKAPHLDTPPGTPAVLPCGEEPVTCTPGSVLLPGDMQTRPCSPAEAVSREQAGDTGAHMEKVISTALASAQRPHTLRAYVGHTLRCRRHGSTCCVSYLVWEGKLALFCLSWCVNS